MIAVIFLIILPGVGTWRRSWWALATSTRRCATRPGRGRPGLHLLCRAFRLVNGDRDWDRVAEASCGACDGESRVIVDWAVLG